jgi:hypothetical protein
MVGGTKKMKIQLDEKVPVNSRVVLLIKKEFSPELRKDIYMLFLETKHQELVQHQAETFKECLDYARLIFLKHEMIEAEFCFDYEADRVIEIIKEDTEFHTPYFSASEKMLKIAGLINIDSVQSSLDDFIKISNKAGDLIWSKSGFEFKGR